ncbi:DUF3307 domain-containing protein [bacterium]|nr:DUF3307 domain-containing protein [bacterium]
MAIFYRLLLAHLLADFPLQTRELYSLRSKGIIGVLPHGGVFLSTAFFVLFPYWDVPVYLLLILALALSHVAVDYAKVKLESRRKDSALLFFGDQGIHILLLFIGSLVVPPIPDKGMVKFELLCLAVFVIWVLPYIEHYLRVARVSNVSVGFIRLGIFERGMFFLGVIISGWYLLLIPVGVLPRIWRALNIPGTKFPLLDWLIALGATALGKKVILGFLV